MSNVSYHQAFDFETGRIFDEREDKCIPNFYLEDRLAGDEIVKREMVEIITPGDRLSRPVQRVTDVHRKRWPRAYAAFKSGVTPDVEGTPLASWPELSRQLEQQFRSVGFQTVEQLAQASDGQLTDVPNGVLWRRKAQVFVEKNVKVLTQGTEIEALRKMVADLTALVKGQASVLPQSESSVHSGGAEKRAGAGSDESAPRRGPGRPRKSASVDAVQPGPAAGASA